MHLIKIKTSTCGCHIFFSTKTYTKTIFLSQYRSYKSRLLKPKKIKVPVIFLIKIIPIKNQHILKINLQ